MSMRHWFHALALVLVCGGWAPGGGEAVPAEASTEQEPNIVALCGADSTGDAPLDPAAPRAEVDASDLGTLSKRTIDVVAYQTAAIAADYDVSPNEIRVKLLWDDQFNVIYGVRVAIATAEHTLPSEDDSPDGPLVNRCTECGELELCTATIEGVVEALARYEESIPPPPAPPSSPPKPPASEPTPRKLGALSITGISTLSVGAATTLAGGLFLIPGDLGFVRVFGPSYTNYRPAAITLLAVGSAAMITGATLLGVGQVRRKRTGRLSLSPVLSPSVVGITGTFRM